MATKSLSDIAEDMRGIDLAMLSTRTEAGEITSRPMSNNGEVAYEGTSYYFTHATSRLVAEIAHDPRVGLTFAIKPGLLSGGGTFIAVQGGAELVRDKARFAAHWSSDLESYFDQGIDTPDLTMIEVRAKHIRYWYGAEQGEFDV